MKEVFSYINIAGEVCYARGDGLFAIIGGSKYAEVRRGSGPPRFLMFNDWGTLDDAGGSGFAQQPGPIEDVTILRGEGVEALVQILLALKD